MHHANYEIVDIDTVEDTVTIRDIGPHDVYMTVTNDAAHVVTALGACGALRGRRLFYYDSEGRLDEIVHKNGYFLGFKTLKQPAATT